MVSEPASPPPDPRRADPRRGEFWQAPGAPALDRPAPPREPHPLTARLRQFLAPLAALAALLAKFGLVLIKFKSVVFAGTIAISLLAYAQLWGWQFALGFVLLILVHELGHVIALRVRGIRASALVFVPLLGAFTAWKDQPRSAYEHAETALAGPLAGSLGALAVGYVGHTRHSSFLLSLAFTGLLINLINLVPIPALPLDGGKVAGLLHPSIWLFGTAGLVAYELYRPSAVIAILAILAVAQLFQRLRDRDGTYARAAAETDAVLRARISTTYLVLVLAIVVGMHATFVPRQLS